MTMLAPVLLLALTPPVFTPPEPPGVSEAAASPAVLMARMSMIAGARDFAGWVRDGDYDVTAIGDGLYGGVDLTLEQGAPYSLAAVCGDCESIALEAFGPDGERVAEGRPFGESWMLEFEPAISGEYRVMVQPKGCAAEQCLVAFAHFMMPDGE